MPRVDPGHEGTDVILSKIERRIRRVYRQAEKDVEAKWKEYVRTFEEEDKKQAARLAAGEISKQDYQKWRTRHIAMGKRWEKLKDTLAEDYHKANLMAAQLARDGMADVYALNLNYGTYMIENSGRIDTGFTLYNHDAAEALLQSEWAVSPESGKNAFLPKPSPQKRAWLRDNADKLWNADKIQAAVTQGILTGESAYDMAKRLMHVGEMDQNQAIRNARTMGTNVQNYGRVKAANRAASLGVKLMDEWVAILDHSTRHSHRMMHGKRKVHDQDVPFENGCRWPGDPSGPAEEIYNCFIPETKIASDSNIVRSYKHMYNGEVYSIETASGVHFTATPNHPILTPRGWIPVKLLNNGDDLFVTSGVGNEVSRRNPDINHAFPSMNAIHELFYKLGGKRTCRLGVDFHGDIATTDVEIITQKRFLSADWNPGSGEGVQKLLLKDPNSAFVRLGALAQHFWSVWHATFGLVGGLRETLSFLWRGLRHTKVHGFGTASLNNPVLIKLVNNRPASKSKFLRKFVDGAPVVVFADKIVNVSVESFSGHVYNLQTQNGYYFVNDSIAQMSESSNCNFAIAHNCRCDIISWVQGLEGDTVKYNEAMGEMTFEEWQEAK